MAQLTEDNTALLTRMSQKPGVQSTLILSRQTGAIVRTSGLVSKSPDPNPESTLPAPQEGPGNGNGDTQATNTSTEDNEKERQRDGSGLRNAEDVARVVWQFFEKSGSLVDELMGKEDEVRLLRLRMKKNELVVVPDANFLMVVIHDTPPA